MRKFINEIHENLWNQFHRFENDHQYLKQALMGIGALYLLKHISIPRLEGNLLKKYGQGSWAIVTGGSDGIGRDFCLQLAKEGFNIIIVSRTTAKMEQVSKECQLLGVQTKIISVDFGTVVTESRYEEIYDQIKDLDISILVNNVGHGYGNHVEKLNVDYIFQQLHINAFSTLMMTKIIFNKLLNRQKRSLIVAVNAGAAIIPIPYFGVYSATKGFQKYFIKSLNNTYGKIDFHVAYPLGVKTAMMKGPKTKTVVYPEQCVNAILKKIKKGQLECIGATRHELMIAIVTGFGTCIQNKFQLMIGNTLMREQA